MPQDNGEHRSSKTQPLNRKKPLSPHLTIYKFEITTFASIVPRIAGIFLYFSFLAFLGLLIHAIYRDLTVERFASEMISAFAKEGIMKLFSIAFLFSFLFSLFLFIGSCIRHFFNDLGYGFSVINSKIIAWLLFVLSLIFSLCLTYSMSVKLSNSTIPAEISSSLEVETSYEVTI